MDIAPPTELADWEKWPLDEPYEDLSGPFFFKRTPDGLVSAFKVDPKHLNGGGAIHGGMLMTFADYSLFTIAKDALKDVSSVTIALNGEFTAAGPGQGIIYASGEVVQETGSMAFVRGTINADDHANGTTLLSFSGIVKKLRNRI